ncbi:MAG: alpha/beta hydrolase [Gammaproteobacteria bacterium]|jgi:pimeloyl-ACP methyl ester carboxylesterase
MNIQIDGKTVAYSNGSGHPTEDAPLIVFLHGAGMDHSVWVMPARYFARHGYRVMAVDLPGHGRSDGPALDNIDEMADWVKALIERIPARPSETILAGHSMGSLICMSFAARYPDLAAKVLLLGTSAPMPVADVLLNAAQDNDHAAIDMANTWSHGQRSMMGASDNPGTSNLYMGERLLERVADDVYFRDFTACNGFSTENYPAIETPTLIITGDEDKMTPPKAGMAVADMLKNSQITHLQDCGHSMLIEQPNQTLDAMAGFIFSGDR